jgi:hypothetical protein
MQLRVGKALGAAILLGALGLAGMASKSGAGSQAEFILPATADGRPPRS